MSRIKFSERKCRGIRIRKVRVKFHIFAMSSSFEDVSDEIQVRRPKRDKSPVRKRKIPTSDSGFNSAAFELVLRHSDVRCIWVMANVCKHWRNMIKTELSSDLEKLCLRWIVSKSYNLVSIFYNFYYLELLSLRSFEFLRNMVGFCPWDFQRTCLAPWATSAAKKTTQRSFCNHPAWVEFLKSRKPKGTHNILECCLQLNLNYSTLKFVLLKVANNSKIQGSELITLKDMVRRRLPASLIQVYYNALLKNLKVFDFANYHHCKFSADYLPYFEAAGPILKKLFPRFYAEALLTVIESVPAFHPTIEIVISQLVRWWNSPQPPTNPWTGLDSVMLPGIVKKLTLEQLSRFLPILINYINVPNPVPIAISSQRLLHTFLLTSPEEAATYFVWTLFSPYWKDLPKHKLGMYLRGNRGALNCVVDKAHRYFEGSSLRQEMVRKFAKFLHDLIFSEKYATTEDLWQLDDVVERFLKPVVSTSAPKLIGAIYYPNPAPARLLTYPFDFESKDPGVIAYNFLKERYFVV